MGGVDALRGKRVYLDTNVFIYVVEGSEEHAPFLEGLFALLEAGELSTVTSELTLAEVLAKPFEEGRTDIAQAYEEMLVTSTGLSVMPVERAILVEAARLVPRLGLKLPDAIHVATAMASGCDVLLSNDRRIKVPASMILARLGNGEE